MVSVGQRRARRVKVGVRNSDDNPVTNPVPVITATDVVREIFTDGALPPRSSGSIYCANEQPLGILHSSRDWEQGAALHAAARVDPDSGAAYHGAPWDWTISGVLITNYQYFNIWHELTPYVTTGLPANVRVQYRNVEAWVLNSAQTVWTKVLGTGVAAQYQSSSGRPDGGYFRSTPDYAKELDIGGWSTTQTTANGSTIPASPGAKWRAESTANGGGWSIELNPMRTSGGALIDDVAILHGPFLNTTSPDRMLVPTGGYCAYKGEARLIMEDYSTVPVSAKYVATLGSDIFTAQTAAQDPPSARSTSMCNPRHRVLPTDGSWIALTYCSGSPAMIRGFPAIPFVNA